MQREEAIVFRLKFKKYLDAVEFLRRVAEAAERLNHHPDVELRYVNLALRLTTHDAGNKVTDKDLRLAEEIQKSGGVQRRASSVAPAPQPRASVQRRGQITLSHQQGTSLRLSTPPQPTSGDSSSGPDALFKPPQITALVTCSSSPYLSKSSSSL